MNEMTLREVPPGAFAATVADMLATGARYRMLLGTDDRPLGGVGLAVEAVLGTDRGGLRIRAPLGLADPSYPALAALVPAALWDEREAAELLGLRPVGLPDGRRLLLHERYPDDFHPLRSDVSVEPRPEVVDGPWTPRLAEGEGVDQLPVGPIHAGVIEPGHFRFSVVGERVLYLDARLGYTHRGLERLVQGRGFQEALPIVERACGVCCVTHALAYSQAVESLTSTVVPERARWARVLLGELERTCNHVGDLGNICAGIGFHPGTSRLGMLKERLLRLNDALTGHRWLQSTVVPGGLRRDLAPERLAPLSDELDAVSHELAACVRLVLRSEGALERLERTGRVSAELVESLGGVGPTARAAGIDRDLRRDEPYAAYGELEVPVVTAATGDVVARFHVRAREAHAAIRLAQDALARLPDGPVLAQSRGSPAVGAVAIAGVEGPRGPSWVWLRAGHDGTVGRLRLRSGSFANWPVVAAAVPGDLVPDFPLINKSFELCYACTDR